MARREETLYDSPLPIDNTIEWTKDIHTLFTEDKADFIAFSTTKFSDPYGDNLLAKITTAEDVPSDEQEIEIQKTLTQTLEQKMDVGRIAVQKFFNFVEDAFPNNNAKLDEAGKSRYVPARQVPERMITLLGSAKDFADANQAALTAKGYSATMALELSTSKTEINDAMKAQNKAQDLRRTKTQARRTTINDAYNSTRDLCEDAKIIYVKNFAKYNQYLIPGIDTGSVVSDDVPKGTTVNIWHRTLLPTDQFKIESLTGGLLKFCLSPDDTTACSVGVEVPAGSEVIISASQLGDVANKFLNVTNSDLSNDGKYRVTVL